ncbi:hypothetical protein AD929_11995 [Gluconobacter potus]|uniref:Uncharacterized protein n=3 Tax=Acetobacteraceae TaxID=433 RepID=A0A1Z5YVC2_9PROT|nr:hypothetical protein AD929_11995 [Gluconobacter potus]KXV70061.1 hypothetical protein AD951_04025 [Acetobacter malorum]OUJ02723.1 hypothetical protein HK14_05370 [Acetobacter cibinongensis]
MLHRGILMRDVLRNHFEMHHVMAGRRLVTGVAIRRYLIGGMFERGDQPCIGGVTTRAIRTKAGAMRIHVGVTACAIQMENGITVKSMISRNSRSASRNRRRSNQPG